MQFKIVFPILVLAFTSCAQLPTKPSFLEVSSGWSEADSVGRIVYFTRIPRHYIRITFDGNEHSIGYREFAYEEVDPGSQMVPFKERRLLFGHHIQEHFFDVAAGQVVYLELESLSGTTTLSQVDPELARRELAGYHHIFSDVLPFNVAFRTLGL